MLDIVDQRFQPKRLRWFRPMYTCHTQEQATSACPAVFRLKYFPGHPIDLDPLSRAPGRGRPVSILAR